MPELEEADLVLLRRILVEQTGIVLDEDKDYLFHSRLQQEALEHSGGLAEFLGRLRRGESAALDRLVSRMTTQETFFFRDLASFELLASEVLPELIQKRATTKTLRIWSAACSTGQEPYSVAALLRSRFPELERWQVEIIGTDICDKAIARCQAGLYSQHEVNRGLPIKKLVRYFAQEGNHWRVGPELRSFVSFERQNLLAPTSTMARFDLILCRNVLMYFQQSRKETILRTLRDRLSSGGVLVLGATERILTRNEMFRAHARGTLVYYTPTTIATVDGRQAV